MQWHSRQSTQAYEYSCEKLELGIRAMQVIFCPQKTPIKRNGPGSLSWFLLESTNYHPWLARYRPVAIGRSPLCQCGKKTAQVLYFSLRVTSFECFVLPSPWLKLIHTWFSSFDLKRPLFDLGMGFHKEHSRETFFNRVCRKGVLGQKDLLEQYPGATNERIRYDDSVQFLLVLKILGQKISAAGRLRGGNDKWVPKRQLIAILNFPSKLKKASVRD